MEALIRDVATLVTINIWVSVIGVIIQLTILARLMWLTRGIHANTEALMRGQEHIAELAAEVLRRTRP